ncbi:MAG: sigma-70 factor domain-containing protein, partial [Cyanobacteriota bacterium]
MRGPSSTDVVRQYLRDIGRVAMLSDEEELTLARLVQHRQRILDQHPAIDKPGAELAAVARALGLSEVTLRQILRQGRRAKERMIQANLRLVVAVAKKYQGQGMELLDLVQEGTLGLERGVE